MDLPQPAWATSGARPTAFAVSIPPHDVLEAMPLPAQGGRRRSGASNPLFTPTAGP